MTKEKIQNYQKMIINYERAYLKEYGKSWKLELIDSMNQIKYENAESMIDIFSSLISTREKNYFIDFLVQNLKNDKEEIIKKDKYSSTSRLYYCEDYYLCTAGLSFFTLIKLGYINEAIDGYKYRIAFNVSYVLFSIINDILQEHSKYFNINHLNSLTEGLEEIEKKIEYMSSIVYNVRYKITCLGMNILKDEIKGINIEINRDKVSVINKINYLELDKKYEIFLNQLDDYINSNDEILLSGMISNFRSFWEQLLIDLGKKVCVKKSICFPDNGDSMISNSRKILREYLKLTDNDNSLISRYVDILHENGGHCFIANKEYFRLSKNIGIEILLMLLYKVIEI